MWGEGAFEELRSLLPAEHVVAAPGRRCRARRSCPPTARSASTSPVQARAAGVPTHFLVAFGPQAELVRPGAQVAQADLVRAAPWERQREANLAFSEAHRIACSAPAVEWFEEWRGYINELGAQARTAAVERRRGRSPPTVRVAFVVNDLQLSGGVGVVVEHARQLRRATASTSTLVLAREQEEPDWAFDGARRHAVARAGRGARGPLRRRGRDLVGDGRTRCSSCPAERHAYFVQSLEDRFYRPDEAAAARRGAHARPAAARHHRGALDRRDARASCARTRRCLLVRNGIDKDVFAPADGAAVARRRAAADPDRGQPAASVQGRARGARGVARR